MIRTYAYEEGRLIERSILHDQTSPAPLWIDLVDPTEAERSDVSGNMKLDLPSHHDMHEIEASSRLFMADDVAYMTVPVLAQAETEEPRVGVLTFVLTPNTLVTIRYLDPRALRSFADRVQRRAGMAVSPHGVLIGIVEAWIDRMADVLEIVGSRIDSDSRRVFADRGDRSIREIDLQDIVQAVGRSGDLISKAHDSLGGFARMIAFINTSIGKLKSDHRSRLKTALRDIRSLTQHSDFLGQRVRFLLDAALGLINHQQSNIVRGFSVAATGFLPPTLIASIYGMNFDVMPELHWAVGYPLALGLMLVSAVLPLWYFRRRGWL